MAGAEPPPEEGAPPEAEEIVAQRAKIAEDIAFYEARIKQADLATARVAELAQQIAARSLESSLERLAKRYGKEPAGKKTTKTGEKRATKKRAAAK